MLGFDAMHFGWWVESASSIFCESLQPAYQTTWHHTSENSNISTAIMFFYLTALAFVTICFWPFLGILLYVLLFLNLFS